MPVPPVESTVKLALDSYNARFSKEVPAYLESLRGRIIRVRFEGNILHSCCALDYFDDLSIALEEASGAPHTVVQYEISTKESPHYSVEIASLDFLGEIERVMEEIGDQVLARMAEFKKAGSEEASLFSELCYCILTANYTAEGGMRIQKEMQGGFNDLPRDALTKRLRELRYRFPNVRAGYIVHARCYCGNLLSTLQSFKNQAEAREWFADNVKGYGFKESSHFLRNIGFTDVAIIDRHIIRFLGEKGLIADPRRGLTRKRYLAYEKILRAISERLGVSLAELDLYLWYMMTGKVLK